METPDDGVFRCAYCEKRRATGLCRDCLAVVYCSEECATRDAVLHKRLCVYTRQESNGVPLGLWPPADFNDAVVSWPLKALLLEDLRSRASRLDAITRLAFRVIQETERYRGTPVATEGAGLFSLGTKVWQFDRHAVLFKKAHEFLPEDEQRLLGQPYWYSVDTELSPIPSLAMPAVRILPYGPAPGLHTIEAPNYTPDSDGIGIARPPLKRALVQLLLSYWADVHYTDEVYAMVMKKIATKTPAVMLSNIPYVSDAWSAIDTVTARKGLFLETTPARHELIPLEELIGEYAAIRAPSKRSARARALSQSLGIRETIANLEGVVEMLKGVATTSFESPLTVRTLGEIVDYQRIGKKDSETQLSLDAFESLKRLLAFSPDLFHTNDTKTRDVITNIISQVLYTVWMLQNTFECTLSNLTLPNVYVAAADPKTVPVFYYPIGQTMLEIPNMGVRVVLPNLEHSVLTVRLGSGKDRYVYHVTSSKTVEQVLVERLIPISESRIYADNITPRRYDPSHDLTTFFNSLAIEPRWGIHRHPLVTHYLGHEERAHVLAFGHNRMFRRVALDYMMAFGLVRQGTNSSLMLMAVHSLISRGTAFLTEMIQELDVRNVVQEELVGAFRNIMELYTEYRAARRDAKANETTRNILVGILKDNPMRVARIAGALAYIHNTLDGGNVEDSSYPVLREIRAILTLLWKERTVVNLLVYEGLVGGNLPGVLLDALEKLFQGDEGKTSFLGRMRGTARDTTGSLMWKLAGDAGTQSDNAVESDVTTNAVASLLHDVGRDVTHISREIVSYIVPRMAASYLIAAARALLEQHFRPLLTREAIVSGAAMPSNVTFAPFQFSVASLPEYMRHVVAIHGTTRSNNGPDDETMRPMAFTATNTTGKKKKISDAMPGLLESLKKRMTSSPEGASGLRQSAKEDIEAFTGRDRAIRGLISAEKLRRAAYERPTDLVAWFARPEAVGDASPVIEEMVARRDMVFGAGKQGFVVGYEVPDGQGYRAIKLSNAVSDLDSIRPVEMTRTSVVSSPQINEIIVSAVVSELYERGVSPHFLQFHGAMLTKVAAKTSFMGRTGYVSPDEVKTALDDFVIDLLEHEHGADMAFVLTNVANTVSIVLIESLLAITTVRVGQQFSTIFDMVRNIFSVLQRSVEDMVDATDEQTESPLAAFMNKSLRMLSGKSQVSESTVDEVRIVSEGDVYTGGRLMSIYTTLKWLAAYNPATVVLIIDALRRAFGLAFDIGYTAIGGRSASTGEGSAHVSANASETLRLFAAYKAGGAAALPARLRVHVEQWLRKLDEASKATGGADNATRGIDESHMYQIVSSMEAIDGDFASLERIVVVLQNRLAQEFRDKGTSAPKDWERFIPTLDEYVDNAIVQTVLAIAQFQQHCAGNHFDFHPANLFIKLCDNTLFNGKPLRDHDYFNYEINGKYYRVRNLGLLVKIGDMGHSTLNLMRTSPGPAAKALVVDVTRPQVTDALRAEQKAWQDRLIIHKSEPVGVEALFAHNMTAMRYMLNKMAEVAPESMPVWMNVGDVANKITGNLWARHNGSFLPAYDLGHFMNAAAMIPFSYRSLIVHDYHKIERLRWIATYGNIDGMPQYGPNMYFPVLAKYSHPIAEKQLTTPVDFLEQSNVFDAYRVTAVATKKEL